MSDIAIQFDNVGKLYKLGLVGTGSLVHDLNRWWKTSILRQEDPYLKIGETNDRSKKGSSDYVWALKDITFDVKQGDVVGIIGKNGAGKSTLLKLLSRVTSPTTGAIRAKGRIASLLEVGTGFHPELTGRENIYMNGSIMGMTRYEIDRKLDEIVDFAGVERYIDTPVKRYSSGMTVRLGFAVAAFLEPEILVVDEVLAVGDAEFQKKAIGKMQNVSKGEGRTVLFVSHNMNSVKMLCNKGIVLKNGQVDFIGNTEACINHYAQTNIEDIISHCIISEKNRIGINIHKHKLEFKEAWLLNPRPNEMANNEPLIIKLRLKNNDKIKESQFAVGIYNNQDQRIAYYHPKAINIPQHTNDFFINIEIPYPALGKGTYKLQFDAIISNYNEAAIHYDIIKDVLSFTIKYIHYEKKDEFLRWDSSWGLTLHEAQGINISISES